MNKNILIASHCGVVRFGERGYVRRELARLLGFHESHKGGRFVRFLADFAPNSLLQLENSRGPILLPSGRQAQFFPAGIIADVACAVVSAAIDVGPATGLSQTAWRSCTAWPPPVRWR